MSQPDLFSVDLGTMVRNSDPQTSRDAAIGVAPDVNRQGLVVLRAIVAHHHRGATPKDIVIYLAYSGHAPQQSVVAKRCSELRDHGYIVPQGQRDRCTVWVATPEGIEAAR